MALLALMIVSCQKPEIIPTEDTTEKTENPGTDNPSDKPDNPDNPGGGGEETEDPEEPKERWLDTGADLPDYPTYNKVSRLEDFPRVDVNYTGTIVRLAEGEFTYVDGTVSFSDPTGMYKTEDATNYETYSGVIPMKIRYRGNTSWDAEGGIKHSYRLKLMDATRSSKEPRKVFGMKKDSDWYLLADVQDPTLLRNALALRLSRMVSMPWTPKYRCCEVYVNGSYAGCYLLCEAKEADRNSKAPITVIEDGQAPDQGGYLLEIDNKGDYDRSFRSESFYKKIKFKDPDFGDKNNPDNSTSAQAQMAYIQKYVNDVEALLNARNFDAETGYRSMMEVPSFIGNFIVHEVTKNMDGGMRLSTYLAKDTDTKLFMPFVWDFDLTLGNYNEYPSRSFDLSDGDTPQGWFIRLRGGSFDYNYPYGDPYGAKTSYYQCLFEDPQFVADLKEYWNKVKPRLDKIPAFIDKMVEYNALAYDHNSQEGKNPRANNRGGGIKRFSSWRDAVDYMKDFYTQRVQWLDTNINALEAQHYNESTRKYEAIK